VRGSLISTIAVLGWLVVGASSARADDWSRGAPTTSEPPQHGSAPSEPAPNSEPPNGEPAPPPKPPPFDPGPKSRHEIRDGVVLGFDLSLGAVQASGYPNDPKKIDVPDQFSRSSTLVGAPLSIVLLGAISDYVNVGFDVHLAKYSGGDWESTGGMIGLRAEGFPFVTLYPKLASLGILGAAGVGWASLHEKSGRYPDAETAQSYLQIGAFYEWPIALRGCHFALGPQLAYDAVFSRSFDQSGAAAGARIVFYTGR
jgi:hypothetical protein